MTNRIMEKPVERKSSIEESDNQLRVIIPQQRRTGAVVVLSFLLLYCITGLAIGVTLTITTTIHTLWMVIALGVVLYFVLKGLGWQLKGKTTLTLENGVMLLMRKAPFRNTEKTYDLMKIKTFSYHDFSANMGPAAMFQMLGVLNRHRLVFVYGYGTLTIPGDLDVSEIKELSSVLNKYLNRFQIAQS